MTLAYLRQNPMADLESDTTSNPDRQQSRWKFSKGKFSVLLGGNLIVWVIFIISVMDIQVFSMNAISLPKISQKLAISGILYNEKTPTAIISNQVYGIGDVVDDYTITRITQTEVEFQKDEKIIIRQVR